MWENKTNVSQQGSWKHFETVFTSVPRRPGLIPPSQGGEDVRAHSGLDTRGPRETPVWAGTKPLNALVLYGLSLHVAVGCNIHILFPPLGNLSLHVSGSAAQRRRCPHEIQRSAEEARGDQTINTKTHHSEHFGNLNLHIFFSLLVRC